MKQIELIINKRKALYHSESRIVTHMTNNGVMIECEMPKDWALTRVFQFMESLLKSSELMI